MMTLTMMTLPTIPKPLHPIEFCAYWVPIFQQNPKAIAKFKLRLDRLPASDREELQTLSVKLLQNLFPEHTYNAIYKWVAYRERCPYSVQVALGALDAMWRDRTRVMQPNKVA